MTIKTYRIQLDGKAGSPNKKFDCASCRHKKRFRRYYDYEKKEYIGNDVGLCDRPRCGYHLTPKEYFNQHPDKRVVTETNSTCDYVEKPLVHFQPDILKRTLKDYEANSFIKPLLNHFTIEQIEKVIADYYIGTINAGFMSENEEYQSCLFWFIDNNNSIRAGQIKLFDESCHTTRYITADGEQRNCQTWIHSFLRKRYKAAKKELPQWLKDYIDTDKVTCLYGEHLLPKYPNMPIALVEAPKTAIIGSLAYPQFLWLATTSLSYLTKARCKVLKGRRVVLFPDAGVPNPLTGKTCFQLWQERVEEFKHIADFEFSSLLEEHATEEQKNEGYDLADYILRDTTIQPIEISTKDIATMPVNTRTGSDFGNFILSTIQLNSGKYYDILFDKDGELITVHEKIEPLAQFFNKTFIPAKLNGLDCLINIVNN